MRLRISLEMMVEISDSDPLQAMERGDIVKGMFAALGPLRVSEILPRMRVTGIDELDEWEASDDGWES